jgi:hypothetical protein
MTATHRITTAAAVLLSLTAASALTAGARPADKPRSIGSAGAFGLLGSGRESYGSGGIVLNTPHGVCAPAP